MIVRFDFESDGEAVADVDDAGVFFASTDKDARGFGGKAFQERSAVFVGAMLAPHDGEDSQFSIIGVAAEDAFDFVVFLRRKIVLSDQLRRNCWFGHLKCKCKSVSKN